MGVKEFPCSPPAPLVVRKRFSGEKADNNGLFQLMFPLYRPD
jgi:hypothetical protein